MNEKQKCYIRLNDKTVGPITKEALLLLISEGRVTVNTLVRGGKNSEWIEAHRIKGLSKALGTKRSSSTENKTIQPPPLVVSTPIIVQSRAGIIPRSSKINNYNFFDSLGRNKRIVIIGGCVVVVAMIGILLIFNSDPQHQSAGKDGISTAQVDDLESQAIHAAQTMGEQEDGNDNGSLPLIEEVVDGDRSKIKTTEKVISIRNPHFRGVLWGMSMDEVKQREDALRNSSVNQNENLLVYETSISGLDALLAYKFVTDKLVSTKYVLKEKYVSENSHLLDHSTLKGLLTKKYGRPIDEKTYWTRELYKDDPGRYGFAVSIGDLSYFTNWENKETEIALACYGENYSCNVIIEYHSKKHKKLAENSASEKNLKGL